MENDAIKAESKALLAKLQAEWRVRDNRRLANFFFFLFGFTFIFMIAAWVFAAWNFGNLQESLALLAANR